MTHLVCKSVPYSISFQFISVIPYYRGRCSRILQNYDPSDPVYHVVYHERIRRADFHFGRIVQNFDALCYKKVAYEMVIEYLNGLL